MWPESTFTKEAMTALATMLDASQHLVVAHDLSWAGASPAGDSFSATTATTNAPGWISNIICLAAKGAALGAPICGVRQF